METFPEPSQWFASRSRYIRTLAVMSIVGYILGLVFSFFSRHLSYVKKIFLIVSLYFFYQCYNSLGDRHAENILFDQTTGDCVHVDVNMLFERVSFFYIIYEYNS